MLKFFKRKESTPPTPVVKLTIYIEPLHCSSNEEQEIAEVYAQTILGSMPLYIKKEGSTIKYKSEVIYVKEGEL